MGAVFSNNSNKSHDNSNITDSNSSNKSVSSTNERTSLLSKQRNSNAYSINSKSQDNISLQYNKQQQSQSIISKYYNRLVELFTTSKYAVLIHCFLLLSSALGNSIYFKKMLDHMPNHVYFVNQFTSVLYVPIFYAVVWYQQLFTTNITPEMTNFPKSKFLYMGIFDGISGLFMMFGAVHTSGSVQALLANAVIPVTMYMSYVYIGTKYHKHQVIGATVIMMGLAVVLLPQMLNTFFSSYDDDCDCNNDNSSSDLPLFNFLFLLSVVPMAMSSIYKEVAFVDVDIDINYMQAWTSNFQMLIGFLLVPFSTMSFLGNQALSWSQLITAIPEGWSCLTGYNVITPPHCQHGITEIPIHGLPPCDNCAGSYMPLLLYMIFNMLFNVFTITVIKYGGSTLMFVVMTLRLPLTQFAFSLPQIQYPPDTIEWPTLLGLAFIIAGLVFYKYTPPDENEDDSVVIPPILGMTQAYNALRHQRAIRVHRNAKQIRSALYANLGIIPSPPTPLNNRNRQSLNNLSPLHSSRTPTYIRNTNISNIYYNNNSNSSLNRQRSISMDNLSSSYNNNNDKTINDTLNIPHNTIYNNNQQSYRPSGLRQSTDYRIDITNYQNSDSYKDSNT